MSGAVGPCMALEGIEGERLVGEKVGRRRLF